MSPVRVQRPLNDSEGLIACHKKPVNISPHYKTNQPIQSTASQKMIKSRPTAAAAVHQLQIDEEQLACTSLSHNFTGSAPLPTLLLPPWHPDPTRTRSQTDPGYVTSRRQGPSSTIISRDFIHRKGVTTTNDHSKSWHSNKLQLWYTVTVSGLWASPTGGSCLQIIACASPNPSPCHRSPPPPPPTPPPCQIPSSLGRVRRPHSLNVSLPSQIPVHTIRGWYTYTRMCTFR